jgi:hypothetical protein
MVWGPDIQYVRGSFTCEASCLDRVTSNFEFTRGSCN